MGVPGQRVVLFKNGKILVDEFGRVKTAILDENGEVPAGCCCCNCAVCMSEFVHPETLYVTVDTAVTHATGGCEDECDSFNAAFEVDFVRCERLSSPERTQYLWRGPGPNFCDPDEQSTIEVKLLCLTTTGHMELRVECYSDSVTQFLWYFVSDDNANPQLEYADLIDEVCSGSFNVTRTHYGSIIPPFSTFKGGCRFGFYLGGNVLVTVGTSPP